jgi:hypothetical protein
MVPFAFLTGAIAAGLGVAVIWFAWRKTKARPLLRVMAMTAAVLFALGLNVVTKEINKGMGQRGSARGYLGDALAHDRSLPQSRDIALESWTVFVAGGEPGLAADHALHTGMRHRFVPRIAQRRVRNAPAWRSVRYCVHRLSNNIITAEVFTKFFARALGTAGRYSPL